MTRANARVRALASGVADIFARRSTWLLAQLGFACLVCSAMCCRRQATMANFRFAHVLAELLHVVMARAFDCFRWRN
jgi:hypothetical protein